MKNQPEEILPTRASLLLKLKDWQDQASWQRFFDTYWKLMYGVARKAGLTDSEAEEVVQETLISVAKHIPTFQYDPSIGSFKGWLLNMTRWRIVGQLRKRKPGADAQRDEEESGRTATVERVPDPKSQDLNAMWEAEWEKNLLEAALENVKRRLDPQKFQIFTFYVHKEWTPEKVASQFGVSVDQVYQIKHRVTDAIKSEVRRLEKDIT